jgi:secreted PhoX family phosphatase
MRNILFTFILVSFCCLGLSAQDDIFKETIKIPAGYVPKEVVLPPSPLKMQVLFVGGHDIVQTTKTYNNPAGRAIAKEWHDFIGLTPDNTGASQGWVTVNHEMIYHDDKLGDGGGMTMFKIKRAADGNLEIVDQKLQDGREGKFFNVDFVNTVGETGMNCGGIIAPNGRIWTAEEWFRSSTASIHTGNVSTGALPVRVGGITSGYGVRDTAEWTVKSDLEGWNGLKLKKFENFNWMVEIDPKQAKAIRKQYNWGRAGWEGGAISNDLKTVYLGNDEAPSAFFKFVTEKADDYSKGKMYFYKHDAVGSKWLEIPSTVETLKNNLNGYAIANGATVFLRNEWVAIDQNSGYVYWTETGRDDGGKSLASAVTKGGVVHPYMDSLAVLQGLTKAADEKFEDPYGRVWYYDPATSQIGVAINGGPWFAKAASPEESSYPEKHLSNPDGLNVMTIDGKSFLVIQEDLNGTSYGRVPAGVTNTTCEMWLLDVRKAKNAKISDLIRISAVPAGAEITGCAITPDGKSLLVNSQHPSVNNAFPFNHSLTYAIHGFDLIKVSNLQEPDKDSFKSNKVYPNPTTREIYLEKETEFAIYNLEGKRLKTFTTTNNAYVGDLSSGIYFLQTKDGEIYKFVIQ